MTSGGLATRCSSLGTVRIPSWPPPPPAMVLLTEEDQTMMDAAKNAEHPSQRTDDAMTDGAEPAAGANDVAMPQTEGAEPLSQHTAAKAEAVKKETDLQADDPNQKVDLEKDDD